MTFLEQIRAGWRPGREIVLGGMRWDAWRKVRSRCGTPSDPLYAARAGRLTLQSALNEILASLEEARLNKQIARRNPEPPLFVLGSWRSGTTYLQRLLACDPGLATPTGLQVLCPHIFFLLEGKLRGRLPAWALRTYGAWVRLNWGRRPRVDKRASDNVTVGPQLPAEDEFAMLMMGRSDLLAHLVGPELAPHYRRYLDLSQLSSTDQQTWQQLYLWYLRKLTLRYPGRRLLLKSPQHTARLDTLIRLFPGARFLHLTRHPLAVYRSLRHHLTVVDRYSERLQPATLDPDGLSLDLYAQLYDAFLRHRHLIPQGQLAEVRFEDLKRDPVKPLRQAYSELGLEGFDRFYPRLLTECREWTGYRKNRHRPLEPEQKERLLRRWEPYFEALGYSLEEPIE